MPRGFIDDIDFTGRARRSHFELEFMPESLPVASDGCGNFWVIDVPPGAATWGPVYYWSHDAPVVLVQARSLGEFVAEALKLYKPPHRSLVDAVHQDKLFDVWTKNPGVIPQADALASADSALREFASRLTADFGIIDLRSAPIGMGFSWGRYGPDSNVQRFGAEPIFGYQQPAKKPGLFARLFGPA